MSDGALSTPTTAGTPTNASTWKLYVAAAIGAFLLGLTDYVRHGTKSTVVALNYALSTLNGSITLLLVLLLMTPILGLIAAWIYKPTTERDAFTLGFAVFSIFALVPSDPAGPVKELEVSPASIQTGAVFIAPAFAQQASSSSGTATVVLKFEGPPPGSTAVSVRNLTADRVLGVFDVEKSLKLVGHSGDRIQLAFEAPGYRRTVVELTLGQEQRFDVNLEKTRAPLFLQRLYPAMEGHAVAVTGNSPDTL